MKEASKQVGIDHVVASYPGNGQPLVFCNVNAKEEEATGTLKFAEDAIVNRTEAEKVVSFSLLCGGVASHSKLHISKLTTEAYNYTWTL